MRGTFGSGSSESATLIAYVVIATANQLIGTNEIFCCWNKDDWLNKATYPAQSSHVDITSFKPNANVEQGQRGTDKDFQYVLE